MRFYTPLIVSGLLMLLLAGTSCSFKQQQLLFQQQNPAADSARVSQANNGNGTIDYHIRSQDMLQIRNLQSIKYIVDESPSTQGVSGGATTSGQTFQVDDDGTVALPALGRVQVAGLTRAEAEKHIEELYRKNLLVNPIIELKITNLKITFLGEIRSQGNFPLVKDKTNLIEMIGQAGGLTDKANEKDIKIIRGDPKNPQVTVIDLSNIKTLGDPRIILQNNDIIYISQNKRAVKNDQLQNFTTTVSPIFIVINSALILYTLIRR
jgi:polysaccharide export outer membrane protein